jgi:hypothetical protein
MADAAHQADAVAAGRAPPVLMPPRREPYEAKALRILRAAAVRFRRASHLICHCGTEREAVAALDKLKERFAACGLVLHGQKTKGVAPAASQRKEPGQSGADVRSVHSWLDQQPLL